MPISKIIRDRDALEAPFLRLEGQPQASGTVLEPFDRPGLDGIGFVRIGQRGRPFTLLGFRDFDDMATASAALSNLVEELQGEACTIRDSSGVDHANMVCLAVRPREPRPVLLFVGGIGSDPGAVAEVEMDFIARA